MFSKKGPTGRCPLFPTPRFLFLDLEIGGGFHFSSSMFPDLLRDCGRSGWRLAAGDRLGCRLHSSSSRCWAPGLGSPRSPRSQFLPARLRAGPPRRVGSGLSGPARGSRSRSPRPGPAQAASLPPAKVLHSALPRRASLRPLSSFLGLGWAGGSRGGGLRAGRTAPGGEPPPSS